MPELPDVEQLKKFLVKTSLHQEIAAVEVFAARMTRKMDGPGLNTLLRGRRFEGGKRHGKYLFAALDDGGGGVVFHFGMDGYLLYLRAAEPGEDNARLAIHFSAGNRLTYNSWRMLGLIAPVDNLDEYLRSRKIGPDALDPAFDFGAFRNALSGKKSPVKVLLMDQHIVAGIGNIYADEILFQAGVHPCSGANGLTGTDFGKMF